MSTGKQRIVAAAFIRKGNLVLLARRSLKKTIAPGRYHLPGGHVEFGESIEQTIVREIKEEFNIDVIYKMPFYSFTYTQNGIHTVGVACWAQLIDESQPLLIDSADNEEIIWATKEEALSYLHEPRDHNYEAVCSGYRISDSSVV